MGVRRAKRRGGMSAGSTLANNGVWVSAGWITETAFRYPQLLAQRIGETGDRVHGGSQLESFWYSDHHRRHVHDYVPIVCCFMIGKTSHFARTRAEVVDLQLSRVSSRKVSSTGPQQERRRRC